ncbi:hypothetical protein NIES37_25090 [Tolypothrix tenuis PCC 7101]|uniref:Uncharacterized protein n=1 Tax=Tolypothrix tenuis PCC 7101 TaxID=231146 RepID=A0A1Z4MYK9_9CYAN|nr:hypothetical protein NIES37_25090 [Tolypothrix tenuis PCC 7101]BAZ77523.1 hypothetical protein NIES50_61530 [Aulosira laxa NIES-50]
MLTYRESAIAISRSAVGCVGKGLGKFAVVVGGGVDEPAYAVSIIIDEDGSTVGATKGVVVRSQSPVGWVEALRNPTHDIKKIEII